jgi:hypothetical protein
MKVFAESLVQVGAEPRPRLPVATVGFCRRHHDLVCDLFRFLTAVWLSFFKLTTFIDSPFELTPIHSSTSSRLERLILSTTMITMTMTAPD